MRSTDPRVEVVQAVLYQGGDAHQVVDRLAQAGFLVGPGQAHQPYLLDFPADLSYHQLQRLLDQLARRVYYLRHLGVRVQARHRGRKYEIQ